MKTVTFKILGEWVTYTINDTGKHETLCFDDTCLLEATGEVGPYRLKSWRATNLLRGAARELHNIPALYGELNAG